MNAPETYEIVDVPAFKQKVEYYEDQKLPNAGTFLVYAEDHTLGNLIRMKLVQESDIKFAGYRQPHPLDNKIEIKVQTNGQIKPVDAMDKALSYLQREFGTLANEFQKELEKIKKDKYQQQ